ncbi:hypothetical protein BDB00DRAFT_872491 [Zychaea mexicana]|uniref:uncharacterized protein n=1 Tax=Zychaea mexicana TaxID=64656 RepID=UPI0022FDC19D|nr:uncharacterized protein BDB00DRAFT_872491 [Zychaea mexicana]KAI9493390.1 hypothetical protein BDB00DRAFT_872491 [Zychaea mexicana]
MSELIEYEDIVMEENIYNDALPFAEFEEDTPSPSSSSLSPPPSSSSLSPPSSERRRRAPRKYTQEDVVAVLKAYFYEGRSAEEAGATVGMPKSTAAKLIRTYRPRMPAPPPRPRHRARPAQAQPSIITKISEDVLASALQQ